MTPTSEVIRVAVTVQQHAPMPSVPIEMQQADEVILVGGLNIGVALHVEEAMPASIPKVKRPHGQRGTDSKKRAARKCSRCSEHNFAKASECKGRGGTSLCQYFKE